MGYNPRKTGVDNFSDKCIMLLMSNPIIDLTVIPEDAQKASLSSLLTTCLVATALKRQLRTDDVAVGVQSARVGDKKYHISFGGQNLIKSWVRREPISLPAIITLYQI
jgi:hypothetical protein